MNISIKPLHWIFKFSEILIIFANNWYKTLFKKTNPGKILISKMEYPWKTLLDASVYKILSTYLENDCVFVSWRSKRAIFSCSLWFLYFPAFQFFARFGTFKNCARVIYRVPDKKTTLNHVSRLPSTKLSVWPLLDLVTLNDLEYGHRKLRTILRNVPDTIHVVMLTDFHLIRL